jgi:hypothetical protein
LPVAFIEILVLFALNKTVFPIKHFQILFLLKNNLMRFIERSEKKGEESNRISNALCLIFVRDCVFDVIPI